MRRKKLVALLQFNIEKHDSPKKVADTIGLLHEGATAVAHITRDGSAADEAKAIAARMLQDCAA